MPVQSFPIPSYNLNTQTNNTFQLSGLEEYVVAGRAIGYRRRLEPIEGQQQGRIESFLRTSEVMLHITNGLSANMVITDSDGNTTTITGQDRTFLVTNQGIWEQNTPSTWVQLNTSDNLGNSIPFVYGGVLHFFNNNNTIWRTEGSSGTNLTLVSSNLQLVLTELNIQSEVTDLAVWQNRLWVVYDNYVFRSDTNDLSMWRNTEIIDGARITSNAGFQRFFEADRVTGIAEQGNNFYVFLDTGRVYSTRVLDVQTQFGFTPILENLHYVGGKIKTRVGFIGCFEDGIYRLGGDSNIQKISNPIDTFYRNLGSFNRLSTIVVEDNVYWQFPNFDFMIVYNFIHNKIAVVPNTNTIMGTTTPSGNTLDDFRGVELEDRAGVPIGDLGEDNINPVAMRLNGDIIEVNNFVINHNQSIGFNFVRNIGARRTNVRTITITELENYRIRVKENLSNNWGPYFIPDEFNKVRIEDVYVSPDIEITYDGLQTITNMTIDYDETTF